MSLYVDLGFVNFLFDLYFLIFQPIFHFHLLNLLYNLDMNQSTIHFI
jgi:hypothetical protein